MVKRTRKKTKKDKEWLRKKPESKEKDRKHKLEVQSLLFSRSTLKVWYSRCLLILPQSDLQEWTSLSQHFRVCSSANPQISEKNETERG